MKIIGIGPGVYFGGKEGGGLSSSTCDFDCRILIFLLPNLQLQFLNIKFKKEKVPSI